MNLFDMHIHSTHSDGKLSVVDIFDLASLKNLRGISITDHDSLDNIPIALDIAKNYHLSFIPGIELSAFYKGDEVHILGYDFDYQNKDLNDFLKIFKSHRQKRAFKIIELLNKDNINIDKDDLLPYSLDSIGRPHIAELLIKKGYAKDKNHAFKDFLGDDSPYYVEKLRLPIHDAISLIKNAGGFTSPAHPKLIKNSKIIPNVIGSGLDAIEAYHSKQSVKDSVYFIMMARRNGLFFTGGSDFHGYDDDYKSIGSCGIDFDIINRNLKIF